MRVAFPNSRTADRQRMNSPQPEIAVSPFGLSDASPSLIQEAEKEEDAHSGRAGGRKSNDYIVSKAFPERGKFDRKDGDFYEKFRAAQEAILSGTYPQLIPEGSSGSYFVRDVNGNNVAVFKPKDEEPFAPLNPKWPKFLQRTLCFCCFGRACLIPDNGYMSETGASLVDEVLQLNVVPKTRVVRMASPTFFYSRCCGRDEVRPKEGSFQLFVHGYESAYTVFGRWNYDPSLLTERDKDRFRLLFQRMCILDYAIRNTDRHMDNLLIRHIKGEEVQLAAIDNGLAFPVKHPESISRVRKFSFRWAQQPWAEYPWNEELRKEMLQRLTPVFVYKLCLDLKNLFRHSHQTNRYLICAQMRVLRGQLWNLRESFIAGESPADLTKRSPLIVSRRDTKTMPTSPDWNQWFRAREADTERSSNCCW